MALLVGSGLGWAVVVQAESFMNTAFDVRVGKVSSAGMSRLRGSVLSSWRPTVASGWPLFPRVTDRSL